MSDRTSAMRGLLNGALTVCGALVSNQDSSELEFLHHTFDRLYGKMAGGLGLGSGLEKILSMRLLNLLKMVSSIVESSDLLTLASETEMLEARRYLCVAGRFVRICSHDRQRNLAPLSETPIWPAPIAEHIGAPLFLFILALLRAGYARELDLTVIELERISKEFENQEMAKGGNAHSMGYDFSERFLQRIRQIWGEHAFLN